MEELDAIENQPDAKRQAMGTAAVPLRQTAADHPARAVVVPNGPGRPIHPKQSPGGHIIHGDDDPEPGLKAPVLSQSYIVPPKTSSSEGDRRAVASPLSKPLEPPSVAVISTVNVIGEGGVAEATSIHHRGVEPSVESAEREPVQLPPTTVDENQVEDPSIKSAEREPVQLPPTTVDEDQAGAPLLDLPPIAVLDDGVDSDSAGEHVTPHPANAPLQLFEKRQDLLPIPQHVARTSNDLPIPMPTQIRDLGPSQQPSSPRPSPMMDDPPPGRVSTPSASSRQSSMYASPPRHPQQPIASTSATPSPVPTPAEEMDHEPLFLPGTPDSLNICAGSYFQTRDRSEATFSRSPSQPLDGALSPKARLKQRQILAYVSVPPAPPHVLRFQRKQRVMRQQIPQTVSSSRTSSRGKSAPPVEEGVLGS